MMKRGLLAGFRGRLDESYRMVMLGLMIVEIALLAVLVYVEVFKR